MNQSIQEKVVDEFFLTGYLDLFETEVGFVTPLFTKAGTSDLFYQSSLDGYKIDYFIQVDSEYLSYPKRIIKSFNPKEERVFKINCRCIYAFVTPNYILYLNSFEFVEVFEQFEDSVFDDFTKNSIKSFINKFSNTENQFAISNNPWHLRTHSEEEYLYVYCLVDAYAINLFRSRFYSEVIYQFIWSTKLTETLISEYHNQVAFVQELSIFISNYIDERFKYGLFKQRNDRLQRSFRKFKIDKITIIDDLLHNETVTQSHYDVILQNIDSLLYRDSDPIFYETYLALSAQRQKIDENIEELKVLFGDYIDAEIVVE